MKTIHVSTSATLFLKLVFPTLWTVFFGTLLLGSIFSGFEYFGPFPAKVFLPGLGLFFLLGVSILYWLLFRIKRVDMNREGVYVTNYFKNYRYTFDSMAKINERDYGILLVVDLLLKEPGSFGKKMTFVASRNRYRSFIDKNPDLFVGLLKGR